jgi:hypothetical protein
MKLSPFLLKITELIKLFVEGLNTSALNYVLLVSCMCTLYSESDMLWNLFQMLCAHVKLVTHLVKDASPLCGQLKYGSIGVDDRRLLKSNVKNLQLK